MIHLFDTDTACRVRELIAPRGVQYVYVETFGCQQNEADSEVLCGMAVAMGYTPTADPSEADLILVNTCAIRELAEKKALSSIGAYGRLRRSKSELIIGVCGCMTAQHHRADELKAHYPYVSFTLSPGSMYMLPQLVYGALTHSRRRFEVEQDCSFVTEGMPIVRREAHRAWVSIMYGCNNFCSYCIVPYVRGRERSRCAEDIIAEVCSLVDSGTHEITLLGQNVNSYRGEGCDFTELLRRICHIEGDFLIRFMTSHPKDVPPSLIDLMAQYPHRIAPHFHLPLQSGSDRILREMNRRYDTAAYLSIVDRLRSAMPEVAITTDIIVGFPGETERDFEDTLDILRRVRYDLVYSFIYSPRRGTPAAEMEGAVERGVASARMTRLLELQDDISLERARIWQGRDVKVLVDGASKTDPHIYSGRTPENKLVHFPGSPDMTGSYVTVHIDRSEAFALYGTVIK